MTKIIPKMSEFSIQSLTGGVAHFGTGCGKILSTKNHPEQRTASRTESHPSVTVCAHTNPRTIVTRGGSLVPVHFSGQFPKDYLNTFPNWGFFTKEEVEQNRGKLLMMDIDFGRYCSLNCPGCFRKSNVVDDVHAGDMVFEEIVSVIDQAVPLGLRSVKLCGAGEPTENSRFLEFVQEMTRRDVGVAIFTKGQVLGSDEETRKFYGKYGISSALELCQELYTLKTSVMLSFQSFDTDVQDALVGKTGHTFSRNRALENLVQAGFNASGQTRLCLANAPITKTNADEVFDIYVYARERNIYPVIAVSMVSGKQLDSEFLKQYDLSEEQKVDLWTKIYSWNIQRGIQTLEQIKTERISAMPGSHPCNQIGYGLYITLKGEVVRCPGYIQSLGNVRTEPLKDIWERSQQFSGRFNCGCPPKEGITISSDLYEKVIAGLEKLP